MWFNFFDWKFNHDKYCTTFVQKFYRTRFGVWSEIWFITRFPCDFRSIFYLYFIIYSSVRATLSSKVYNRSYIFDAFVEIVNFVLDNCIIYSCQRPFTELHTRKPYDDAYFPYYKSGLHWRPPFWFRSDDTLIVSNFV